MRRLIVTLGLGLAISSFMRSPRSIDAATIEGRVVDSDGKPLARAEVRIWQKVRGPGGRFTDRSVEFDGRDVLFTDAEGRFTSPDVLVAGVPAQIVAEAAGMVAGRVLASLAERLFSLEEDAQARRILAEAETDAEPLFPDYGAQFASLRLALAAMHDDVDRAIGWLAKSGIYLKWHGGRVAVGMLPESPCRAVEVWQRVAEAMRKDRSRTGLEYCAAAEFCYRLALVDRGLAEQVAADADETVLRYREKGAIILALAETEPGEASRRLAAMVREELSQLPMETFRLLPLESAPAIAAWLLPVAEKVDPGLCGELFWRSLALRSPRPRRDDLNGQVERTDIELAKLLARYDRDVARALLEPLTAKAFAPGRFLAVLEVDPRWAKSLLDTVYDVPSSTETANRFRFYLIQALALPLQERWNGRDGFGSVSFWQPSAQENPLSP